MDYLEKAGRVLDIEIFELKRLRERLGEDFSRAVDLIKETVDARGKIVVVGVGKSGHIGAKIAATLTSTGSPAVVLDSSNALHGDLGVIADGDVVLALSASGETEEMVRILPAIARFQVRIIAICGDPSAERASVSRREYRTGSVSVEPGADVEHHGDAGPRRRVGDGFVGGARIRQGGFREVSSRRNDRAQHADACAPGHAATRSHGDCFHGYSSARRAKGND